MQAEPVRLKLIKYLSRRNLREKFDKQISLFISNPKHPSLNVELLEPKELKVYSFRLDKKYRVIFLFKTPETIEIVDINNHYAQW